MAKLFFYYSAMNAGKSTMLLQANYNYQERGMGTMIFAPNFDNRMGDGVVASRIGLKATSHVFDASTDLLAAIKKQLSKVGQLSCVLIDEAQFLNKQHIWQLCEVVDELNVPVLAYGLRTDFRGEPFIGSQYLLALADQLIELKTVCFCGKKATMNIRMDVNGHVVRDGEQIEIGGNERYLAVCRYHLRHLKQVPSNVLASSPILCKEQQLEVEK